VFCIKRNHINLDQNVQVYKYNTYKIWISVFSFGKQIFKKV